MNIINSGLRSETLPIGPFCRIGSKNAHLQLGKILCLINPLVARKHTVMSRKHRQKLYPLGLTFLLQHTAGFPILQKFVNLFQGGIRQS